MREYRVFLGLSVTIALLCLGASRAEAGGCPERTVAEEGGTHWCYDSGKHGHVHLWKPGSYDRDRAVTVVYVHGYNLGDDNCPDAHYVDCAWTKHRLAKQFADSGLDALFVAIEGPVNDSQRPKWTLDALLDSLPRKGGIKPPMPVVAVGHSGGAFTIERFLDDGRLKHVILLDGGYQKTPKKIAAWYAKDNGRRLTLVGAEGTHWSSAALGKKLKCDRDDDLSDAYTKDEKDDRCVCMIDKDVVHMDVIRAGKLMPLTLSRVHQPPPPKHKPPAKGGSASGGKPHKTRHRKAKRSK